MPGGSRGPEKPRFLDIGRVVSPFGVSGELRVHVLTDFPQRFKPGLVVRIGDDLRPFRVESVRWQEGALLLKLEGCDAACAEGLRSQMLRVPVEEAAPLPPDHYYLHDIIGLEVQATDGRILGRVVDVLRTGANDVYVVEGPFGEVLIPAIDSVVKSVDVERGIITVELLEGLL